MDLDLSREIQLTNNSISESSAKISPKYNQFSSAVR